MPDYLFRGNLAKLDPEVYELTQLEAERQARKKRNTLLYAYGDIARRCRATDPMVPAKQVRHVLNALKAAGALTHADGRPVRSPSAQFTVRGDADELTREQKLDAIDQMGEEFVPHFAVPEL